MADVQTVTVTIVATGEVRDADGRLLVDGDGNLVDPEDQQ